MFAYYYFNPQCKYLFIVYSKKKLIYPDCWAKRWFSLSTVTDKLGTGQWEGRHVRPPPRAASSGCHPEIADSDSGDGEGRRIDETATECEGWVSSNDDERNQVQKHGHWTETVHPLRVWRATANVLRYNSQAGSKNPECRSDGEVVGKRTQREKRVNGANGNKRAKFSAGAWVATEESSWKRRTASIHGKGIEQLWKAENVWFLGNGGKGDTCIGSERFCWSKRTAWRTTDWSPDWMRCGWKCPTSGTVSESAMFSWRSDEERRWNGQKKWRFEKKVESEE